MVYVNVFVRSFSKIDDVKMVCTSSEILLDLHFHLLLHLHLIHFHPLHLLLLLNLPTCSWCPGVQLPSDPAPAVERQAAQVQGASPGQGGGWRCDHQSLASFGFQHGLCNSDLVATVSTPELKVIRYQTYNINYPPSDTWRQDHKIIIKIIK